MRSVTSCFNSTLYRKNLSRFWPIWALYSVIWLFALPLNLLTTIQRGQNWALEDLAHSLDYFSRVSVGYSLNLGTVLVSSHNLRELEDVCDHVGILSRGKVLLQRSLTDLQDNVVKMQIVFQEPEMPKLPEDLDLLHVTQVGRIHTLIVRGSSDVIKSRLAAFQPILMEALPLTLEEIFIYELGGEDYAVRDIML